jgi:hypothetical protein
MKGRSGERSPNWKGAGLIGASHFNSIQRGALRRGIPFEIQIEDLVKLWEVQEGRCALTGQVLLLPSFRERKQFSHTDRLKIGSIDRIDSTKGYVHGNLQWVTTYVNLAKNNRSQQEFLEMVQQVYEHRHITSRAA